MRYPEFLPRARVAVDLALGLVLDGKEEEASSVLRRSIESDPDNPAVRAVLGAIETTAADTAVRRRGLERIEAITDLDWGSGPGDPLVPTMSAIYRHIWEGLFRNQQYERAVIAIEHSLKYAHEKEIPLLNLGMTYNKMARHEQALAAFDGVLEMNADDPEAHFQTGVANGAMGRYQKALAAYRRAVSLRPAFSEALLNLGVTHLHLGRLDSAESAFRRALEARTRTARDLARAWRE